MKRSEHTESVRDRYHDVSRGKLKQFKRKINQKACSRRWGGPVDIDERKFFKPDENFQNLDFSFFFDFRKIIFENYFLKYFSRNTCLFDWFFFLWDGAGSWLRRHIYRYKESPTVDYSTCTTPSTLFPHSSPLDSRILVLAAAPGVGTGRPQDRPGTLRDCEAPLSKRNTAANKQIVSKN